MGINKNSGKGKLMKKHISNVIAIIIFICGLSLLLYPIISNFWNDLHQTKAINSYIEKVDELDRETYERLLKEANDYNKTLIGQSIVNNPDEEIYNSILNVNDGQIGYIQIPKINLSLPIYHGTSEEVLQIGIGHVANSSFPTGEIGTHTVLLGHRGLPTTKLFTDLPKLEIGDIFYITVFDRKISFEVDEIKVVEPNELENIIVEEDQTYATLVTCTPYAINSHRLLVRGHKVEINEQDVEVIKNNNYIYIWLFIMIIILLIIGIFLIIYLKKKKEKKK